MSRISPIERGPPTRCRSGYVLVVTLGLLVLSTTLLVAVGRVAVYHALRARIARDELQRRWGTVSCRAAVLPFAEQVLANAERQRNAPVPVYQANVSLGGQNFLVIVSDEQAKANVNALLESSDTSTAENRIRAGLSGSGLDNSIRLRPAPLDNVQAYAPAGSDSSTAGSAVPRVTGFGQVLDDILPERLIDGRNLAPAELLTCWGNGAINVMRASESSLRIGANPPLTLLQIGRLIHARDDRLKPRASRGGISKLPSIGAVAPNSGNLDPVSQLLSDAGVQVKNRATLPLVMTSACHSVWVIDDDGRRSWYRLFIQDESDLQHPHIDSYVW